MYSVNKLEIPSKILNSVLNGYPLMIVEVSQILFFIDIRSSMLYFYSQIHMGRYIL